MLIARFGRELLRLSGGIQVRERFQPGDPGSSVTRPSAPVGVFEMVGQETSVGLAEPERFDFLENAQAETSGSGFRIPTPCSRFVAAIASASPTIASETSASGSAKTIGSPSSA
jgi:hypothetical protein